ncbi:MAG: hypothetical protein QXD43_04255 [Candidatus Aenigmatarchaeota archaeon]
MKKFKIKIGPVVVKVVSEKNLNLNRFAQFRTNKKEDYTFLMKNYRYFCVPPGSKLVSRDFAVKFLEYNSKLIIKPKTGEWGVIKEKNKVSFFSNKTDIENIFNKRILAMYLTKKNSFLVHSSGVMFDLHNRKRVVLFVGPCGTGKSTLCKLFKKSGFNCFSDELNIIIKKNGKFYCYGTPAQSSAKSFSNKKGELAYIFFIKKSNHNSIQDIRINSFLNNLLKNSIIPYSFESKAKFIKLVMSCVNSVKAYTLKFKKDNSVVSFVTNFVTNNSSNL